ncbi:MAG: Nif3-like dinuclear metal center hexameric protein [Kiritimatiellae bacterium]|nr:Nif3-like dinuclear metal center hexameric protein [Kiritimatiellia bacterium]
MSVETGKISGFLDETLGVARFSDVSNNGLQIGNGGTVSKIAFGVDASLRGLRSAVAAGADLLVCHHGLSWGDSLKRITGLNYELVSYAIQNNLAVYAAHLPLDAHPVYGNNAQLCRILGVGHKRPAFDYHGQPIGFVGTLSRAMSFSAFCDRVREQISPNPLILDFGKASVRTVGIVSGGAAEMVDQAAALGVDLYLTGESGLVGYTAAENLGMNVIFAGHYATETWGVRALEPLVRKRFGIPTVMLDFKIKF